MDRIISSIIGEFGQCWTRFTSGAQRAHLGIGRNIAQRLPERVPYSLPHAGKELMPIVEAWQSADAWEHTDRVQASTSSAGLINRVAQGGQARR